MSKNVKHLHINECYCDHVLQVSVLRVDVADFDQQVGYALYSAFAIGPEQEGYSLKILGQYSGDAGEESNILKLVHSLK